LYSSNVNTKLGVPLCCVGIAQVKIGGKAEPLLLQAASENFLSKTPQEIQSLVSETMEGHQRAIIGTMTVEAIYQDRRTFSANVMRIALEDLMKLGLVVVSYTLKDIRDNNEYLLSLGKGKTAQVKCEARMGQAEATKNSRIKESMAHKARMEQKVTQNLAEFR
jgi:flotillin